MHKVLIGEPPRGCSDVGVVAAAAVSEWLHLIQFASCDCSDSTWSNRMMSVKRIMLKSKQMVHLIVSINLNEIPLPSNYLLSKIVVKPTHMHIVGPKLQSLLYA